MKFNYENLPTGLQEYDNFCIWGKHVPDKRTQLGQQEYKRPRSPKTLIPAGTTDLNEFTDYYSAVDTLNDHSKDYDGIGVVLADTGLCAIDIDHIDTETKLSFVEKLVKRFRTYTEYSQSGNGIHILFNADFNKLFNDEELAEFSSNYATVKSLKLKNNEKLTIEFYRTGHSINLTGNVFNNAPNEIRDLTDDNFIGFLNGYLKRDNNDLTQEKFRNNSKLAAARKRILDIGKDGLVKLIRTSNFDKDKKMVDLLDNRDWQKHGYESESESRWFVLHRLAYWTALNPELIEDIYRESELFNNSKWATRNDVAKEINKVCNEHDPNDYFKALAKKDDSILAQFIEKEGIEQIRYNILKNRVEIKVPENSSYAQIYQPQLVELLPIELTNRFNAEHQEDKLDWKDVRNQVKLLAYKDYYNPVHEYLEAVKWDQNDRFEELFQIMHVTNEFDQTLIRKWFRQTTQVVYNDPQSAETVKKTEGVLIIQGPEGIGKSTAFQRLCPNMDWVYISGDIFDSGEKDFKSLLTSHWIYCIDEIDESFKSGNKKGSLKSFVTQDVITYRKPYAENETTTPRMVSLCGTTNRTEFINKNFETRRWWVVQIKEKIDFDRLNKFTSDKANLQQFWVQAYEEGLRLGYELTDEEKAELRSRVADRFSKQDIVEGILYECLDFEAPKDSWVWATSAKVCASLNIKSNLSQRVGTVLSDMERKGMVEKKVRHHVSHYLVPPKKEIETIPDSASTDYLEVVES